MNPTVPPARRAFATLIAIFLIGLIAAATTALASLSARDLRRTQQAALDARLRQLLLAGAVAAVDQAPSASVGEKSAPVSLPSPLASAGAQLTVRTHLRAPDVCVARIEARLDSTTARQELEIRRSSPRWQIVSAALP